MWKTAKSSALGALLALGLSAGAANATILYSNGMPGPGTIDAWIISAGYGAADSFTLATPSILTGVDYTGWDHHGETILTVDWAILNGEPGTGTVLFSGTASVLSTFMFVSYDGHDIKSDSFALPDIALNAGSYWLELDNGVATNGYKTGWDINGGPSQAWANPFGGETMCTPVVNSPENGRCSMAFDIVGRVPEPASLGMLAAGLSLLGFAFSGRLLSRKS